MRATRDRKEFETRLKRKGKPAVEPAVEPVRVVLADTDSGTLTVSDLREMAKSEGIPGYSTLCKAELMRALFDE